MLWAKKRIIFTSKISPMPPGFEYRTLLRAFQHYLQITPKRYLKLRQLNLVRRALNAQETSSATDIMADFGVTEFGRFANDYKRLFHELPSETLRRRLRTNSGQNAAAVDYVNTAASHLVIAHVSPESDFA